MSPYHPNQIPNQSPSEIIAEISAIDEVIAKDNEKLLSFIMEKTTEDEITLRDEFMTGLTYPICPVAV